MFSANGQWYEENGKTKANRRRNAAAHRKMENELYFSSQEKRYQQYLKLTSEKGDNRSTKQDFSKPTRKEVQSKLSNHFVRRYGGSRGGTYQSYFKGKSKNILNPGVSVLRKIRLHDLLNQINYRTIQLKGMKEKILSNSLNENEKLFDLKDLIWKLFIQSNIRRNPKEPQYMKRKDFLALIADWGIIKRSEHVQYNLKLENVKDKNANKNNHENFEKKLEAKYDYCPSHRYLGGDKVWFYQPYVFKREEGQEYCYKFSQSPWIGPFGILEQSPLSDLNEEQKIEQQYEINVGHGGSYYHLYSDQNKIIRSIHKCRLRPCFTQHATEIPGENQKYKPRSQLDVTLWIDQIKTFEYFHLPSSFLRMNEYHEIPPQEFEINLYEDTMRLLLSESQLTSEKKIQEKSDQNKSYHLKEEEIRVIYAEETSGTLYLSWSRFLRTMIKVARAVYPDASEHVAVKNIMTEKILPAVHNPNSRSYYLMMPYFSPNSFWLNNFSQQLYRSLQYTAMVGPIFKLLFSIFASPPREIIRLDSDNDEKHDKSFPSEIESEAGSGNLKGSTSSSDDTYTSYQKRSTIPTATVHEKYSTLQYSGFLAIAKLCGLTNCDHGTLPVVSNPHLAAAYYFASNNKYVDQVEGLSFEDFWTALVYMACCYSNYNLLDKKGNLRSFTPSSTGNNYHDMQDDFGLFCNRIISWLRNSVPEYLKKTNLECLTLTVATDVGDRETALKYVWLADLMQSMTRIYNKTISISQSVDDSCCCPLCSVTFDKEKIVHKRQYLSLAPDRQHDVDFILSNLDLKKNLNQRKSMIHKGGLQRSEDNDNQIKPFRSFEYTRRISLDISSYIDEISFEEADLLWRVFTYYTCIFGPLTPDSLSKMDIFNIGKECTLYWAQKCDMFFAEWDNICITELCKGRLRLERASKIAHSNFLSKDEKFEKFHYENRIRYSSFVQCMVKLWILDSKYKEKYMTRRKMRQSLDDLTNFAPREERSDDEIRDKSQEITITLNQTLEENEEGISTDTGKSNESKPPETPNPVKEKVTKKVTFQEMEEKTGEIDSAEGQRQSHNNSDNHAENVRAKNDDCHVERDHENSEKDALERDEKSKDEKSGQLRVNTDISFSLHKENLESPNLFLTESSSSELDTLHNSFGSFLASRLSNGLNHRISVHIRQSILPLIQDIFETYKIGLSYLFQYFASNPQSFEMDRHQPRKDIPCIFQSLSIQGFVDFAYAATIEGCDTRKISRTVLADIFISSIRVSKCNHFGGLTYEEFWEALVRISMIFKPVKYVLKKGTSPISSPSSPRRRKTGWALPVQEEELKITNFTDKKISYMDRPNLFYDSNSFAFSPKSRSKSVYNASSDKVERVMSPIYQTRKDTEKNAFSSLASSTDLKGGFAKEKYEVDEESIRESVVAFLSLLTRNFHSHQRKIISKKDKGKVDVGNPDGTWSEKKPYVRNLEQAIKHLNKIQYDSNIEDAVGGKERKSMWMEPEIETGDFLAYLEDNFVYCPNGA